MSAPWTGRRLAVAKWLRRYHLTMMGVWILLGVPTVLWWSKSILYVALISLYANFVGEFGAYQAARAEREARPGGNDVDSP